MTLASHPPASSPSTFIGPHQLRRVVTVVVLLAVLGALLPLTQPVSTLPHANAQSWVPIGQAIPDRVVYGPNQPIRLDGVVGFFPDCKKRPHRTGIGIDDVFQPWADVYAVPAGSATAGSALTGPPLVVFGGVGGGFIQQLLGYAGPGGRFAPGVYDIVIDECQDRFVDPEDAIISEAFRVVIPLGAEPATIPPIDKDGARRLGSDYRALSLAWDAALKAVSKGKVAGNAGFLVPTDVSIAVAQGAAVAAGQSPLPDPRPAVSTALLNKSRAQARIAADPPDPLFRSHASLVASRVGPATSDQALEVAIHDAARNTAVDAALVDALVTAVERHQGAAQVGAGDWMATHARDALALLDLLQTRLPQAADDHRAVAAAFRSGADPQWTQWMLHNDILALLNFSQSGSAYTTNAVNRRVSMNRGIPEDVLKAQLELLAPANDLRSRISSNTNTFPNLFDAIADDVEAQASGFVDLRADLERSLDDLAAEGRDRPLPTADAGGPYAASTGVPITLDATGSSGPVGLASYAWDTTLDGAYDTAGATPSVTFAEPGRFLVALQVTDVDGGSSLGVAEVEVTASDLPPTFEAVSVSPATVYPTSAVAKALVELEPDDDRDFELSITVADPEGADLTVTWYRDGTQVDEQIVTSGATATYTGAAPVDEGVTWLFDAVVTDAAGNVVAQPFMVTSFGADDDGDGWRTPLDCDDADRFVNPGSTVPDRDCNPDTSSSSIVPQAPVISFFSTPQFDGPLATSGAHQNDELFFSVVWSHPNRVTGETFDVTFEWGDGTSSSMQVAGTTAAQTTIETSRSIDTVGRIRPRVCITAPEGSTSEGLTGCLDYGTTAVLFEAHQLAPEPVVNPADVAAWTIDTPRPEFIPPVDARWYVQPFGAAIRQENNPNYPHWVVSDFELDAPGRITMGVGSFNADNDWYGFALGVQPGELRDDDADWIAIEFGHQKPPGQRTGRPECDAVVDNPRDAVIISRIRGVPTIEEFLGVTTLDLAADPNPRCNDDAGVELLGNYELPPGLGTSQGLPQYLGWPARAAQPLYRAGMYLLDITYTPERLLLSIDGVEIAAIDAPADDPFPQGRIAAQTMSQPLVRYTASNPAPVFAAVEGTEQTFTTTFADASINSSHEVRFDFGDGSPAAEGSITPLETGRWQTSAEHTYADDGDYEITVCVRDVDNDVTGCGPLLVEVINADPIVDAGPDQRVTGPVQIAASYADPGILDTHTATIDWGDGSDPVAAIVDGSKGSGIATGSHTYATAGTYTVEVCVTDDDGGVGCDDLEVEVVPGRSTPQPLVTDGVTGVEGDLVEVGVGFTDDDTDTTHTITVDWGDGPESVTFQDGGVFGAGLAARTFVDDGVYPVTFEICDVGFDGLQEPLCVTATTDVDVDNAPPTVAADVDVDGALVTVDAVIEDPGTADTHTASVDWGDGSDLQDVVVVGGPGGGSLTASHAYAATGQYEIEVCATDNGGAVGCDGATVAVAVLGTPPALTLEAPDDGRRFDEGDIVTFAGSFTDAGEGGVHTVVLDPGDGSTPFAGDVDQAAGTFTATHRYRNEPAVGPTFGAIVTLCDDTGRCDSTSVDVEVVNVSPSVDAGRDRTVGPVVNLDEATFADPGVEDVHQATVDWDDGTGPQPADVTFTDGAGTVQASTVYLEEGTYLVEICVTDDADGVGCDTATYTVVTQAIEVSVDAVESLVEGDERTFAVTFDDPQPPDGATSDDYALIARWSDGTPSEAVDVVLDDDAIDGVSGSADAAHRYVDDGTFVASFEVCQGARCGSASVEVVVTNAAPTIATWSATVDREVLTVTGAFTDPGVLDQHTATVDLGDGTPLRDAVVTTDGGAGTVSLQASYIATGTYDVRLCVADDGGAEVCATSAVTVTELTNTPPVFGGVSLPDLAEGTPFVLTGSFADPDAHAGWRLSVDWGDGADERIDFAAPGPFEVGHTYRDDGTYQVTLVLSDGIDDVTLRLTDLQVVNLPPQVTLAAVSDDLRVELEVEVTDPGVDDVLHATVDWGDGTVVEHSDVGSGSVALGVATANEVTSVVFEHTYDSAGAYLIEVCASDEDGGQGCASVAVVVGEATTSPPGDDESDPPSVPDGDHQPNPDGDVPADDGPESGSTDSVTIPDGATADADGGVSAPGVIKVLDRTRNAATDGSETSTRQLPMTGGPIGILIGVGLLTLLLGIRLQCDFTRRRRPSIDRAG